VDPADEPPLSGLLLAGGASSRMGRDKASLSVDGEPLAARVARVLGTVCAEVLVASGDGVRLAWLGLPQVADEPPGRGPLGGIVAGLGRASNELVAVVAVDMPFASGPVLELLARTWKGEPAVVPVTERGPEPLHAVYARSARQAFAARPAAGTGSVREALRAVGARFIPEGEWAAADPSGRFAWNVNHPEDLDALPKG
jgi:molybdopterin-guanine dinucleotide biosynthesis protein A